ncbi:MAG: hypothetical protein GY799_31315 [Desulfobulbaceae bacterium]|nr:hypothetical protein [Desulfobulbaceae bacterium]
MAYQHMSYDAVAISSNDLTAGSEFFLQKREDHFPWVAANIFDRQGKLLFSPHIIKKIGSLTVGIIGLTGAARNGIKDVVIGDWRQAVQTQLALLEKNCDMLVVLSNLSTAVNRELQRDFNQIDIIVAADQRGRNIPPLVKEKSLFVQSGGRGKYLGKLDITWQGSGNWSDGRSPSAKALTDLQNRLRTLDIQLHRLEKQPDLTSTIISQKIDRLQSSRQLIADQIAQLAAEHPEKETKPSKRFNSSFLPVKPRPSSERIGIIVQDIKKNINTFNKYRRSKLQADNPTVRLALQSDEIAGIASCFGCHEKQTAFWKNTRHAKAYETLAQRGQSFNLQCLPCHVTAGKVSATSVHSELLYLLTLSNERQTIGCEVCHGPGKRHLFSPDDVSPVRLPAYDICIQCHSPDRDSNFDYQKKLTSISCPTD